MVVDMSVFYCGESSYGSMPTIDTPVFYLNFSNLAKHPISTSSDMLKFHNHMSQLIQIHTSIHAHVYGACHKNAHHPTRLITAQVANTWRSRSLCKINKKLG